MGETLSAPAFHPTFQREKKKKERERWREGDYSEIRGHLAEGIAERVSDTGMGILEKHRNNPKNIFF